MAEKTDEVTLYHPSIIGITHTLGADESLKAWTAAGWRKTPPGSKEVKASTVKS